MACPCIFMHLQDELQVLGAQGAMVLADENTPHTPSPPGRGSQGRRDPTSAAPCHEEICLEPQGTSE